MQNVCKYMLKSKIKIPTFGNKLQCSIISLQLLWEQIKNSNHIEYFSPYQGETQGFQCHKLKTKKSDV